MLIRSAAPPRERRRPGRSLPAAGGGGLLASPASASPSAAAAASRRAKVFGNMDRGVACTAAPVPLFSGWFSRAVAGCHAAACARLPLDAERALLGWEGLPRALPAALLLSMPSASLGTAGAMRTAAWLLPCWLQAASAACSDEVRDRPRGVAAPLFPREERRLGPSDSAPAGGIARHSIAGGTTRHNPQPGSVGKPPVHCVGFHACSRHRCLHAQPKPACAAQPRVACTPSSCRASWPGPRHLAGTHLACTPLPLQQPQPASPVVPCHGSPGGQGLQPRLPARRGRTRQTARAPWLASPPAHPKPLPGPTSQQPPAAVPTLPAPSAPGPPAATRRPPAAAGHSCRPPAWSAAWAAGAGLGRPPAWRRRRHLPPRTPPARGQEARGGEQQRYFEKAGPSRGCPATSQEASRKQSAWCGRPP